MASIQTTFLYNFLKLMSHKDRKAGVRDLMNVWPDEWLNDAITIAQEIRQERVKRLEQGKAAVPLGLR